MRAIVLKARQQGISTYVGARFFRKTHLWRGVLAMVIADLKKRSEALFAIYERFRLNVPAEITPGVRFGGKQHMAFDHDSKVIVDTAKDTDAGRGLTIQCLHASEVAFWDHPADTMMALLQAVPPEGSEVFIESTANGVGNWFHTFWEAAKAGESGYIAIFLPWWIHEEYRVPLTDSEITEIRGSSDPFERRALDEGLPWDEFDGDETSFPAGAWLAGGRWVLTPEQLAWRRRTIRDQFAADERAFRQEFPATSDEAFLVSGNCFFDEERLVELQKLVRKPLERLNLIVQKNPATGKAKGFTPRAAERGSLKIWERPDPKGHYVIGADTATGRQVAGRDSDFTDPEGDRQGRDASSAAVLRTAYWTKKGDKKVQVPPRVVAELHGRMAPEVFAHELWALGNWYSCPGPGRRRFAALIGVERNHSSGETVLRVLSTELNYPNLFRHRKINTATNKQTEVLGWVTSAETRMPMLDELARAIREDSLGDPGAEAVKEYFTFVRDAKDGRPAAQEGSHDDRVIGRAVAVQMLRHHTDEATKPAPEWKRAPTQSGL